MKRILITLIVALAIIGCAACRRCQGQTPTPTPIINEDLVITATEAAEFKAAIEDGWNLDASNMADLMFQIATNSKIPTGNQTVAINPAQLNRWFSSGKGSAISMIYWRLGNVSINQKRAMRQPVIDACIRLATEKITNEARRARFMSQLELTQTLSTEEY